jgi:hypothetical protein
MRHNQNGRRFRGRGNGQGHQQGGQGDGNHGNHGGGHNNGSGFRRVNRGTQTFDSNGPEVRIRGNAYQINEKYLALAKDATSAGDRVLAESYLQHAEHYQRLINEIAEEMGRHQQQFQQQQNGDGEQPVDGGEEAIVDAVVVTPVAIPGAEQPSDEGLEDVSFLRNTARSNAAAPAAEGEEPQKQTQSRQHRQRQTEQV